MNKEAIHGCGKVFRFSLKQYCKSKSTLLMLLLMLLGTAGSVLLAGMSMDRGKEIGTDAQTVYIRNVGTYVPDLKKMPDYTAYEEISTDMKEALKEIDNDPYSVLLDIDYSEELGGWQVIAYTGADSKVTQSEAWNLADCCAVLVEEDRYLEFGAEPEQVTRALSSIQISVCTESEYRNPGETDGDTQFMVGFAYAVIAYMLISLTTSFVIKAIVEEKSSKLIELLMVSVRPLALVTGKILAAMVLDAAGILCSGLGLGLSKMVLRILGREDSSMLSGFGSVLSELTLESLIIVLVSLLLGYCSFAVLSGLSGAACSTVSEGDSAGGVVMVISMVCYITGIATAGMKASPAMTVLSVLPFFSAFLAPARYFNGLISFWILGLSWVLQAAVVLVLAKFSAGVYGALLMHRGEQVKLRQILRLMKGGERT